MGIVAFCEEQVGERQGRLSKIDQMTSMSLPSVETRLMEFQCICALARVFDTLIIDAHLYVTHGDGRRVITRMGIHVRIPPIKYTCP